MIEEAHLFNELRESNLNVNKALVLMAVAAGKTTTTAIREEFGFLPSNSQYWLKSLVGLGLLVRLVPQLPPGQCNYFWNYSLTKKGEKVVALLKERLRKIALDAISNS